MRLLLCLLLWLSAPLALAADSYTDPFAYCTAVGTLDRPDGRYQGPAVPLTVARGLQQAFGMPGATLPDSLIANTVWRCMDGAVYACNRGANIPCETQAETTRTPSPAMQDYCRDHPDTDYIPYVAAGRATVYEWACQQGLPVIVEQSTQPDARGFLSRLWYKIEP